MTVLYVTWPGAEVRKHRLRLRVVWRGETLSSMPLREVERVVLLGPAQLSAAATRALLRANVPVVFGSTTGRYYGTLSSNHDHAEVLLAQVERYRDEIYRLSTARAIVDAKIGHSRSLLLRQARNHGDPEVRAAAERITPVREQLEDAASVPQVMGLEGQAAAIYFPALGRCINQEDLRFSHRTRRPPRDPANALLSLGYMLVLPEALGALAAVGLHPGLGFLHEVSPRRPALALDLLELFRQPVVDRLVLSLLNRRVFTASDFAYSGDGAVTLTKPGLQRYLSFYERAMAARFRRSADAQATSFRTLLQEQARSLRRAVEEEQAWEPLTLRL